MNKKILFLVMSCTIPEYRMKECDIKTSWGMNMFLGRENNMSLWFFNTGEYECIDEKNHRIFVPGNDARGGTFQKFMKTMNVISSHPEIFGDYDYVVRLNISTVPNIKLFKKFFEDFADEDTVWCGTAFNQDWVADHAPFISGECFVLAKKLVNVLRNVYNDKVDFFESIRTTCADDGWMTIIFSKYFGEHYKKHLKTFGIVYEPFNKLINTDRYDTHLIVSYKTFCDIGKLPQDISDKNDVYLKENSDKCKLISLLLSKCSVSDEWSDYFVETILDKECRINIQRCEDVFCSKDFIFDRYENYKKNGIKEEGWDAPLKISNLPKKIIEHYEERK